MDEFYLKTGITYTFNIFNRSFSEHIPYVSSDLYGGTPVVSGIISDEILTGVETVWQTESGKIIEGNIGDVATYQESQEDLYVRSSVSYLRDQVELQKIKISFTPTLSGIYYIQDARKPYLGVRLRVEDDFGDFINPEELYYSLLIRRTNRIYNYPINEDFVEKFLGNYIPTGLLARVTNLPPSLTEWDNNQEYYYPSDTAILSAVIEDPEDDTLSYAWTHIGTRYNYATHSYTAYSVNGTNLTMTLSDSDQLSTTGTVNTPPVETMYTFKLVCADSDNSVTLYNQVPVYALAGSFKFTDWGRTTFYLGDADLPFWYYS